MFHKNYMKIIIYVGMEFNYNLYDYKHDVFYKLLWLLFMNWANFSFLFHRRGNNQKRSDDGNAPKQ